jgi:PhnB protein
MTLGPHLTFCGQCEAAFKFYEQALGGTNLQLARRDGWPGIVHASLTVGSATLAGADVAPDQYRTPQGFYVLLNVKNVPMAERIFTALSENGVIHMPLQPTFWSPSFGVLTDRFGTPWEINCAADPA